MLCRRTFALLAVRSVVLQHGLDLSFFFHELFANRIGGFFGLDVIVSSLVIAWVLVVAEGRRLGMRRLWLPIIASLVVGVSLGLPLLLPAAKRRP